MLQLQARNIPNIPSSNLFQGLGRLLRFASETRITIIQPNLANFLHRWKLQKSAMQQGDYSSAPYYQFPHNQNPNLNPSPNPADPIPNPYASAPPFSSGYAPDYASYTSNYPPYPQNSEPISVPAPIPPTAPSYPPTSNPNLQPFNSSPQPSSFPPFESNVPYQPPSQQQSYYPSYDQHQTAPNYAHTSSSVPQNLNPNSSFSSSFVPPYSQPGSSIPATYESPYENSVKFDHGGAYYDDRYGSFNQSRPSLGSELYGQRQDSGLSRYDPGRDDVYEEGVYAYDGGKVEPYGARGTAPKSSTWSGFDDYGRSISFPKESSGTSKIAKAVPKADTLEDARSGVQKFRVKLLAESGGQSTMDVLCQVYI